ncbi:FkbM family methyltransferase [Cyanobium sp. CH-040]|uniref:FkbM family methyltransferase n=1 Tax=Cyanobium sp. CH-040 TaxID=2823708 RepID=UPI0020CC4756|nr:FkbM family methyltransferase [Cyanobium sp. CH-040]MCP9926729.1 FkbM family methyltransferase [Cyanobium sp. CH-040]
MNSDFFSSLMSRLSDEFDAPETRGKPLQERAKVTAALEIALQDILDIVKPDLVIEVGAFEADFSQKMIKRFPGIEVVALEANPRVYSHFAETISKTGVRYINAAADTEAGTVSFYVPEVIAGNKMPAIGRMGSLHEVGLRDSQVTMLDVKAVKLDDITRELNSTKACLWIDAEGAVDRVLIGAKESLKKTGVIYCEIESSPVWKEQTLAGSILDMLQNHGFIPIARDCQKWFQYNVLCLRSDLVDNPAIQTIAYNYCTRALELFKASTKD